MGRFGLSRAIWIALQVAWILIGLSLAWLHLYSVKWNADYTTLGFVVFSALAIVLPAIKNVNLGSNNISVEFEQQVDKQNEAVTTAYTQAITDLATLMRSLVDAENRLQAVFALTDLSPAAAQSFAIETCQAAIGEAGRWLRADQSEAFRGMLWWYHPDEKRLGCIFTTDDSLAVQAESYFTVSDSEPISDAFNRGRLWNFADLPDDQRGDVAEGEVRFGGIILVPVIFGGSVVAVLEIDRALRRRFDANAEVVASALGSFVGFVMTHPCVRLAYVK